jgi:hypothetical protein
VGVILYLHSGLFLTGEASSGAYRQGWGWEGDGEMAAYPMGEHWWWHDFYYVLVQLSSYQQCWMEGTIRPTTNYGINN